MSSYHNGRWLNKRVCGDRLLGYEEKIAQLEDVIEEEQEFRFGADLVPGHALLEASRERERKARDRIGELRYQRDELIKDLQREARP